MRSAASRYYYDPVSKESTWTKPAGFVDQNEAVEWEMLGATKWQRVRGSARIGRNPEGQGTDSKWSIW